MSDDALFITIILAFTSLPFVTLLVLKVWRLRARLRKKKAQMREVEQNPHRRIDIRLQANDQRSRAVIAEGVQRSVASWAAQWQEAPTLPPATSDQVLATTRGGDLMWTSVEAGDGSEGPGIRLVTGDGRTTPILAGNSGESPCRADEYGGIILTRAGPVTDGSGEVKMEPEPPPRTAWERLLDDDA